MNNDPGNNDTSHKRSWFEKLTSILGGEPKDREELMEMLRDAEERDIVSGEMLGMIERILQVSEMQVREVMVPKTQMISIPKNTNLEKIFPIVIESGHSRFPVLDPSKDDVIGILLAKDLLQFHLNTDRDKFNIVDVMRPAFFTPQSKRLDILLREFRAKRNHIAIVLDEYGHVAGLITIEDVLEQIVGDIEDEYDIEEEDSHIKKMDNGTYIVKASTLIEDFNEHFHTHFSDDEFDTIGGILLKGFEHLPKRGEKIKMENMRFKILHSDNRRIYLLEVKPIKARESAT